MSVVLRKIKEFYGKLQKDQGALLPAWRQAYGEARIVSFSDVITAYTRDLERVENFAKKELGALKGAY